MKLKCNVYYKLDMNKLPTNWIYDVSFKKQIIVDIEKDLCGKAYMGNYLSYNKAEHIIYKSNGMILSANPSILDMYTYWFNSHRAVPAAGMFFHRIYYPQFELFLSCTFDKELFMKENFFELMENI